MRRYLLWLIAAFVLVACPLTPQPKPPAPDADVTGGAAPTGGSSASPGNLAHCIADLTKDPGVANVAKQQGISAKTLATRECADPNIISRHP